MWSREPDLDTTKPGTMKAGKTSNERKVKVKVTQLCLTLRPHRLFSPWNFLSQNTGVGHRSLLQGIFPTQRLNPGLPHCRWILYQLSHQGSPRIWKYLACPFSSGSSWPRNQTRVSSIAGRFFTSWATTPNLVLSMLRYEHHNSYHSYFKRISFQLHCACQKIYSLSKTKTSGFSF